MALIESEAANLYLTPNSTLTSGITKTDSSLPIITEYKELGASGANQAIGQAYHHSRLTTCGLVKATAADAALGFGEKIATFPAGRILPLGAYITLTSTCPTGLSATAGEVGLGSVIASGAIATLGAGAQTMENIMEGTTLANHVAGVALTSKKGNTPAAAGTKATDGQVMLDGSVTPVPIFLNIASTWDQTSAESVTFQAVVDLFWIHVSVGS